MVALSPRSTRRLRRITEYIESRIDQKLTIDELAEHLCMSKFHFMRRFKRATGKTPKAFVAEARIECARCRLQAGLAIAVVAAGCGFSSQSHLNRSFKRATGQTPGQYQRQAFSLPK